MSDSTTPKAESNSDLEAPPYPLEQRDRLVLPNGNVYRIRDSYVDANGVWRYALDCTSIVGRTMYWSARRCWNNIDSGEWAVVRAN